MADEDRAQHQEVKYTNDSLKKSFVFLFTFNKVKNLLHKLETSKVTDPNYRATFDTLMQKLTQHVKEYNFYLLLFSYSNNLF